MNSLGDVLYRYCTALIETQNETIIYVCFFIESVHLIECFINSQLNILNHSNIGTYITMTTRKEIGMEIISFSFKKATFNDIDLLRSNFSNCDCAVETNACFYIIYFRQGCWMAKTFWSKHEKNIDKLCFIHL